MRRLTDAEILVIGWLDGEKSPIFEETRVRAVLAHLLRQNELHPEIRFRLAALFDPKSKDRTTDNVRYAMANGLELKLVARRAGRRPEYRKQTEIAQYLWDKKAELGSMEKAIACAIDKFDIEREGLQKIWRQYAKPTKSGRQTPTS